MWMTNYLFAAITMLLALAGIGWCLLVMESADEDMRTFVNLAHLPVNDRFISGNFPGHVGQRTDGASSKSYLAGVICCAKAAEDAVQRIQSHQPDVLSIEAFK